MASQFLFKEALWRELSARIPKAKKVQAAIAYLGTGGASLLPLRKGDSLVVDMSLARVRAGATNPNEVKKLLKRGVNVFSRASLHAKFLVIDDLVIAGSSNVSKHAKDYLDEAAILTDDSATVQRARSTFAQLCTEPVRKDYLARCIEEYRPPKFATKQGGARRAKNIVQAKVWLIANLRHIDVPAVEMASANDILKRGESKLLDFENCKVSYIHYPAKENFFSLLQEGDWLIQCFRNGTGYDVYAPTRFLRLDSYPRGRGKRRYLLLCEEPLKTESILWTKFRSLSPIPLPSKPKRRAITNNSDADAFLRLWNLKGRFNKAKRA